MAKKTKAETIAEIPIESVIKLGGEQGRKQLEQYVRTLRSSFKRRIDQIKRHGEYSYAYDAYLKSIPENFRYSKISDMSRNKLIEEFARMQSFFISQTSTLKGIKKVNLEQDIRLFGVNKRGLPLKRMSNEERVKYWALVDEYLNNKSISYGRYGSERIHQVIADSVIGNGRDISAIGDLQAFFNDIERRLENEYLGFDKNEENIEDGVYSGKGTIM